MSLFHPQLAGTGPFSLLSGNLEFFARLLPSNNALAPAPPLLSLPELGFAASPGHGSQEMGNCGLSGVGWRRSEVTELGLGRLQDWEKRPVGKSCLDQPLILSFFKILFIYF